MTDEDVLKIFEENGALLTGHFLLTSGLHSSRYLQCALVLQHPTVAEKLCSALADRVSSDDSIPQIDLVVAPAIGGIVVAHEVARRLGVPALFTERQDGKMTLRRGFQIAPGQSCLVVEDVVTTGGSTKEVIDLVMEKGAIAAGAGSLIDRSGGTVDLGVPRHALAVLKVPTHQPADCPLCEDGSPAIKPGSRS